MRRIVICIVSLLLVFAALRNEGTRHEVAAALSAQAEAYYVGDYTLETLAALAGNGAAASDAAWDSPLCAALHSLMNGTGATLLSYADTLAAFSITDVSGGSSEPLRFYCDDFGAYNREQVWPDTRGVFYRDGPGRDLHHIRPADRDLNLCRGSMTFGNVRAACENWQTWPETGEPVLWYDESWNSGLGLAEVRDEIKGDVARILLYVYVAYGQADGANRNLWTDLPELGEGMEASDGLRVVESLDTLLAWLALDPVDTWELGRNDAVQSIQGNRNVFIDYPELAFLLFDRPIPDMPTPSGWAHSLHCAVSAAAEPPEGGCVAVEGHTVTAAPAPGWRTERWTLTPADAAEVYQAGNVFTLSQLRSDCTLTVWFALEDPCAAGHTWDAGHVVRQPACETAGALRFTCTVCGATQTEPIPALGHDWQSQTIAPDCTRAGYTLTWCARCGAETETPGEPPLGHAWDEGSVTRTPTKTLPGERTYRCTRCGLARTEEIPFRFLDVARESAYYFTPVYWALLHDPPITDGTGDTTFSPHLKCTRAQVVTFLWRAAGSPEPQGTSLPFVDVPPGAYYYRPVLWALEQGITSGTSAATFSPNAPCIRAQVVTFLWQSAGRPAPQEPDPPFADVPGDAYYRSAVAWAAEAGIVSGTAPGVFSPSEPCTRAQTVTMLWRAFAQ